MIYHPKTKSESFTVFPSGSGGLAVSIDTDAVLARESAMGDPADFSAQICACRPVWVRSPSSGTRAIKYSCPPNDIYARISGIRSHLRSHIKARTTEYRLVKNRAMEQIRKSCLVEVPVFKYVRTWRIKDITYIKKVKLRVQDAVRFENSGETIRYGTSDYRHLEQLRKEVGPFDKTRSVRVVIHKTIGYWANVKTFVRNRKVISDRRQYDKLRDDWVSKNPPYSASKDPLVAQWRQEIINLKLKLSTEYNQCLAVVSSGPCGSPSECWEAAWAMLSQYLIPYQVVGIGGYALMSRFAPARGFLVRVESWTPGDGVTVPHWYDEINYLDEWRSLERTTNLRDTRSNTEEGKRIHPIAESAAELISWREFSVESPSTYDFRGSYDRAALNLAAGGGNPFEWNFARSFAELKDTRQTVATGRDFLRFIFNRGKLAKVKTVGALAKLYLTYKFGIEPTADELGKLLGTSRALLKHTYPMLRTLNAYATGVATASITGRCRVNFDAGSFVKELFPSVWDQDIFLGTVQANWNWTGAYNLEISSTHYGIAANGTGTQGGATSVITPEMWDTLEHAGVAPKWVWLPESPLVFCKYDAEKVRQAIGTKFADILSSLDTITTMWELAPLSFVVDWFTNMKSSFEAMDDFIHADKLDLVPNGEGPWHSSRFRLCLAVPIYRKKGTTRDFTIWCDRLEEYVEETSYFGQPSRGTFVVPQGASVKVRAPLHGVTVLKSEVTAYARDLLAGAPLLALLPELKVSLNAGKLSSLLAILLSSGK